MFVLFNDHSHIFPALCDMKAYTNTKSSGGRGEVEEMVNKIKLPLSTIVFLLFLRALISRPVDPF